MSYRYMRVIVFFDLPTETTADKRAYRQFRKSLIRSGFVMMQQSVYCRLLINANAGKAAMETVRRNKPQEGLVQMLTITEKQFLDIEYLVGRNKSNVISTDERVIVL